MELKRHTVFILRGGSTIDHQCCCDDLRDLHRIYSDLFPIPYTIARFLDRGFTLECIRGRPDFIVCLDSDKPNVGSHYYNFIEVLFDNTPPTVGIPYIKTFIDTTIFTFPDAELWASTILPIYGRWVIIGDLHSCIDELRLLLKSWGCTIDNDDNVKIPNDMGILFIGDLIDKGIKTKETIDFLWRNKQHFYFVRGNHDEFVYEYLKSNGKSSTNAYKIEHHDSIPFFLSEKNVITRTRFFELYNELVTFAETDTFIATHSPCYSHELGMLNPQAQAFQRQMILNSEVPLKDQMQCINGNNAIKGVKFHVFGHIPFNPYHFVGNKIGIDSGCIHGNALGSVCIIDGKRPEFKMQKFLNTQPIYPEEIVPGFKL